MTPAKLAELEEKAKAATPGERLSVEKSINGMPSKEFTWINPDGSVWLSRDGRTDSEFNAAANPQTILELLASYRKLEADLSQLTAAYRKAVEALQFCASNDFKIEKTQTVASRALKELGVVNDQEV